MRTDDGKQTLTNAGHAVEPSQLAERTFRLTIGDNGLGERKTDSRKASQVLGGGTVDVDALVRPQRPAECENAVAMSDGRLRRKSLKELDFAGRLAGTGGQPTYSLPDQAK
jgi:hypothetical protein